MAEVIEIQVEDHEADGQQVFYHQSTPESIQNILNAGFAKNHVGGADMGQQGFIRGAFIK